MPQSQQAHNQNLWVSMRHLMGGVMDFTSTSYLLAPQEARIHGQPSLGFTKILRVHQVHNQYN
jgi:hypothetical protein